MSKFRRVDEYPGLKIFTILFFLYLYLPIAIVVFYSFNSNKLVSIWTGFSLKWYESALANKNLIEAVKTSLLVAVIATTIATTVALMSALVLLRARGVKRRKLSATIVNLPLLLPEIVLAVAVLILFTQIGISNSLAKLVIAHTTFCIPFAFLPIRARLQGMSFDYEEASADLYANRRTTFTKITLPLIAPGLFAGAMLAFVISMDDFITSNMLNSGGATTLPVYIFGLVKQGVTPELNAISTIIILFSIFIVTVIGLFALRSDRDFE